MESFEDTDVDRETIQANLSTMSFEELQKLKEKIGTKLYNETIFGEDKKRRKTPQTEYKRENKNRPREMSSKRPFKYNKEIIPVKKNIPRDPRFDPLCGTYNEKIFNKSYNFLNDVKLNERKQLKEELENTTDPKRQRQIKYLIQRIDNQIREKQKIEKEKDKEMQEKKEIRNVLKKGEKPQYEKKSEKKIMNLLTQYEELKHNKKLQKHLEKKSKKQTGKDFKKMKDTFQ